ncbi:lipopolysaccharide biosynthesis protein [Parabacteroides sp.]
MAEQSLKDKTAKGLFWGGVSNGVQQLLGMLFGIFLARMLSVDDYGLVGMLAIFTAIANSISESGFTAALTNKSEFRHEDYNAVFWFNLIAGGLLYVLLFLSAPWIAGFFGRPELIPLSRVLFLTIVIGAFSTAHNAVMFKRMMVKERAKIDLSALALSGLVGVSLAVNGFGYWALAWQSVCYSFSGMLLRWYFSPWRPTWVCGFRPIREMFGFSVKLLLTNIFNYTNANLFSVLLGKFYNAMEVGYYSQGMKWMSMGYSSIGGMINGVAQPVFAEITQNKERQVQVLRKMIRFAAFVSFPLMIGLAFIARELILLAVGVKWEPSVPILQLFCFWGAVSPIQLLYSQISVSHGESGFYLRSHVFIGVLQMLVALLMLQFGVLWMVFANVMIHVFVWLYIWHSYVNGLIGIRLVDVLRDISPYLGATLGIFTGVYFVTLPLQDLWLLLIAKVFLSAATYIALMYACKSVILRDCLDFMGKRFKQS